MPSMKNVTDAMTYVRECYIDVTKNIYMPHSSLTISQMDIRYSINKCPCDTIPDGYSQMDFQYWNI